MLLRGCRLIGQRLSLLTQLRTVSTCGCHGNTAQTRHDVTSQHTYRALPGFLQGESSTTTTTTTKTSTPELSSLFAGLHICDPFTVSASSQPSQPAAYILPTTSSSAVSKKTIIDPETHSLFYDLPTLANVAQEKVEPNSTVAPIRDPRNVVEKHARAKLMIIRHKKMKKHKLKKFRKRMIYVHRALASERKKKKEVILRAQEKEHVTKAEAYDPEEEINKHIRDAKLGGWFIDTVQTWKKDKHA